MRSELDIGRVNTMNLLLLNARRRVFLIKKLKELSSEFPCFKTIFADTDLNDPMRKICDYFELIPPLASKGYWPAVLRMIEKYSIRWIIPWLDSEIRFLSERRAELERIGCSLFLPSDDFVNMTTDKWLTQKWAMTTGLRQPERFRDLEAARYPIVIKPRFGQGGLNVRVIESAQMAPVIEDQDWLIQEFIDGIEYTCDIWLKGTNRPQFIVPRRRLKVRGEVMIAQVDRSSVVMSYLEKMCEKLNVIGMFNVQVMVRAGEVFLIEINPRFGGGSDLTCAAGGNFPRYMLEQIFRGSVTSPIPIIRDGLIMTRYYDSYFFHPDSADVWE